MWLRATGACFAGARDLSNSIGCANRLTDGEASVAAGSCGRYIVGMGAWCGEKMLLIKCNLLDC